jgi:hypothetical protein
VNLSASGKKETIVYQIQHFIQVEFKHEPQTTIITDWSPFFTWAIQQRPFDFTPEITTPNTAYQVTLETTTADGKGLAFKFTEELPDLPFHYTTGILTFRQVEI